MRTVASAQHDAGAERPPHPEPPVRFQAGHPEHGGPAVGTPESMTPVPSARVTGRETGL
uniref:Uncharacterized protein n=1 Tax=uncultured virus TaxID=340016 RepID=D5L291_9VIRU|nr:hypothetical protein [uncultured virus]